MGTQPEIVEPRPLGPPKLSVNIEAAAEMLDVSRDTFDRHVLPKIKTHKIGRRRVVAVQS